MDLGESARIMSHVYTIMSFCQGLSTYPPDPLSDALTAIRSALDRRVGVDVAPRASSLCAANGSVDRVAFGNRLSSLCQRPQRERVDGARAPRSRPDHGMG